MSVLFFCVFTMNDRQLYNNRVDVQNRKTSKELRQQLKEPRVPSTVTEDASTYKSHPLMMDFSDDPSQNFFGDASEIISSSIISSSAHAVAADTMVMHSGTVRSNELVDLPILHEDPPSLDDVEVPLTKKRPTPSSPFKKPPQKPIPAPVQSPLEVEAVQPPPTKKPAPTPKPQAEKRRPPMPPAKKKTVEVEEEEEDWLTGRDDEDDGPEDDLTNLSQEEDDDDGGDDEIPVDMLADSEDDEVDARSTEAMDVENGGGGGDDDNDPDKKLFALLSSPGPFIFSKFSDVRDSIGNFLQYMKETFNTDFYLDEDVNIAFLHLLISLAYKVICNQTVRNVQSTMVNAILKGNVQDASVHTDRIEKNMKASRKLRLDIANLFEAYSKATVEECRRESILIHPICSLLRAIRHLNQWRCSGVITVGQLPIRNGTEIRCCLTNEIIRPGDKVNIFFLFYSVISPQAVAGQQTTIEKEAGIFYVKCPPASSGLPEDLHCKLIHAIICYAKLGESLGHVVRKYAQAVPSFTAQSPWEKMELFLRGNGTLNPFVDLEGYYCALHTMMEYNLFRRYSDRYKKEQAKSQMEIDLSSS